MAASYILVGQFGSDCVPSEVNGNERLGSRRDEAGRQSNESRN